ncbi:MAG TPA: folylpolyglutamate synthase/dihydrofolate synthase family protein [Phycisphaerae bacterium]|nr:folylpolyglutamate synthase/dihydrofolate synthase family protein [Phycisphaerae bacterium]HQL73146.1 folylpolyglutamate synthase/dihydrofolate synthase family protein [Phycisphaerae bacterium]
MKYLFGQTDYEQMLRVRYNRDTFNLDRMRLLLSGLGNPHAKLRAAHIAGTKGKGSTATMLAEMLRTCGYKVGLYTSPHICDVRERIRVDGEMISQAALTRLICQVEPIIAKMADKPTFFEIFTAMAFQHFANSGVDVAVVEAGLGGRLDSTNVLTPEVCGLTSISLDHTHQLGDTPAKIAAEKAGIFKRDIPAISVSQLPEVKRVLRKTARETGASLMFTGEDIDFSYRVESSRQNGCHARICLTTPRSRFEHLPVPLLGEHQALNCGLALAMLDQLKLKGYNQISDEKAIRGLSSVYIPGRMELVHRDPRILLDGAHNGASVQALMRAIGQHIPYDSMVMIFGCAADKDINGMMQQISTGADKVIFTRAAGNPRAARPEDLAEMYEQCSGRVAQVTDSLRSAMRIALNAVSREDIICVTGSFYLVGEAKTVLGQGVA